ncbi:MAG: hypothetical protein ACOC0L_01245, partial [bacterium]
MVHTISGQRRVSLIDDEPVVRSSVGAILTREGYTPQKYASGEEVLAAMPATSKDQDTILRLFRKRADDYL